MSIYSAYIEHILKARGKNEEGAGKERGKKDMRRNTAYNRTPLRFAFGTRWCEGCNAVV